MRSSIHLVPAAILFQLFASGLCAAGGSDPVPTGSPASAAVSDPAFAAPAPGSAPPAEGPISDRKLRRRNAAVIGGIALVVGTYGSLKWWDEGMTSSARPKNEGWFGEGTYAGGADKLGHAFFTYTGTRLLARGFEVLGNDRPRSLRLSAWTSFGVLTAVEAVDSFSEKFRFSYEDVVFNAAGTAVALLVEKYPAIDALVDFRLLYLPSDDARRKDEIDPLGDYSGQTYLLAFKADGVPRLRDIPLVRYLELLVGYNARGYEPEEAFRVDAGRRVVYGAGINLSRLLGDTLFHGRLRGGTLQGAADTALEYLQVPGAGALTHERL